MGPLPLSLHLLFLPSVSSFLSLNCICSLSLPCSTISLLSLPLLHVAASFFDETQAVASSRATPYELGPHSQIAVHQHSHTNPTHYIHCNPWPNHHAMPRRRACHAIHHVIGTSHHQISLNRPTVMGFAFGFVWFWMWVCVDGCGFVWFGCIFCRADLFSCVWCGFCFWVCLICHADFSGCVFFFFFFFNV